MCLLLGACSQNVAPDATAVVPPPSWQFAQERASLAVNQPWWQQFGSPELNRLIAQAQAGSYDLAAAVARVQQAQAGAVIAGAPLLPEVKFGGSGNRENSCAATATANWMPPMTTKPWTTLMPT